MSDDRFLCYCTEATREDFAAAIAAAPEAGFDAICAKTNVGLQCTACLLNAEGAFIAGGAAVGAAQPARRRRRDLKRRIYGLVDRWSPHVAAPYIDRIPILAGVGLDTHVTVSNQMPESGELRPVAYRLCLTRRDASGRELDRHEQRLEPGEWFDRRVSDGLVAADGLPAVGTCVVEAKPLGRGYRGSARPHFSVSSAEATAAVHASGNRGLQRSTVATIADNRNERQFLYATEINGAPNRVTLAVRTGTPAIDPEPQRFVLAANGAALVPVPLAAPAAPGLVQWVEVEAAAPMRCYFIIADRAFRRLSLDHI